MKTALLIIIILLFPCALRAELLDRIVATVNTEVITASELNNAIAFHLRLGNIDDDRGTLADKILNSLVTRRLLVQKAYRLKFVEVSEQELSTAVEKLGNQFASSREFSDFMEGLDITREELARMLGEQLLVERFVEKKVGLFVRVSREEAQSYFNDHTAEFKNQRFQDVQKKILALLTEQEIERQLDQYLKELHGKADIRIRAH